MNQLFAGHAAPAPINHDGMIPSSRPPVKQITESIGKNLIVCKAMSAGFHAGDYAKIFVNDKQIDCGKNEHGTKRGLHIVLLDKDTGVLEKAKVFDTYKTSTNINKFIKNVSA